METWIWLFKMKTSFIIVIENSAILIIVKSLLATLKD